MSNIYKIGTRGITPSDNNYLVWDADVRCLYIDKENKVDVLNIVDTFNSTTGYSPYVVPTLAGVKDVFDTDYFNIEDNKRVSPKVATNTERGIASFTDEQFVVDDGAVSIVDASTSNKGVAQFDLGGFYVEDGNVSLKTYQATSSHGSYFVDYVREWETYSDGSWYRLWTSGWLEQGGVVVGGTNATDITISFPTGFLDDKYSLLYTANIVSTGSSYGKNHSVFNMTTTSFQIRYITGNGEGGRWYACGWST